MVFSGNKASKALFAGLQPAKQAWLGGEMVWSAAGPEPGEWWGLKFTAVEPGAKFGFRYTNQYQSPAVNLEYSVDGGRNWQALPRRSANITDVTLANAGDEAWIRAGSGGNVRFAKENSPQFNNHFCTEGGKIAASGSVMSLLDATGQTSSVTARTCFPQLFQNCRQLVTAPDFPSEQVTRECYVSAFQGCSSLTAAPALPAATLENYCYAYMFDGCSSLTAAPELPATTLALSCCYAMFRGCSSLPTAPVLPATALANSCYQQMFQGCASLTAAPALPATALADSCYAQMFRFCSAMTRPPNELPATTLAGSCYYYMFSNCGSLTAAPAIQATQLASSCCERMFSQCTSMKNAPALPATALATRCYYEMFSGSSQLSSVEVGFTSFSDVSYTSYWLMNVAAEGVFKCPAELGTNETITRGESNCPADWTVNNV